VTGGAAATFPIAVGDFSRAYSIVDLHDVRITRDEVTTPGFTKFYVRRRSLGHPTNTNAVKFIRTAA
jgi:HK97 family phage major capsid protein